MDNYKKAFKGFSSLLYKHLIEEMEELNISKEEAVLSDEIFSRLSSVPLVDRYNAYQLLDDQWQSITIDLEMIQTEGFKATKQVDPNMVTKKKKGKDVEVQDGWIGRILPFDLVQWTYLYEETKALKDNEDRLIQVSVEQQEIHDSLTDEDKSDLDEILNDDNTKFLTGPLNKAVKELFEEKNEEDYEDDSQESRIITMNNLLEEEKDLKKTIKTDSEELHKLTKKTIENLSDSQVYLLLEKKWINPIIKGLDELPKFILDNLATNVKKLTSKYATTLSDIDHEIIKTEAMLSDMIDQLTGSDDDLKGLVKFKSLLGGE